MNRAIVGRICWWRKSTRCLRRSGMCALFKQAGSCALDRNRTKPKSKDAGNDQAAA
jgi:hypothetical protein